MERVVHTIWSGMDFKTGKSQNADRFRANSESHNQSASVQSAQSIYTVICGVIRVQGLLFERIPKDDPGEHFADQYPDKKDPRGEPDEITFKWDKNVKEKKQCDTKHMLYLIQIACDLHRRRVIERNKYFTSISRKDPYISHVDTPMFTFWTALD